MTLVLEAAGNHLQCRRIRHRSNELLDCQRFRNLRHSRLEGLLGSRKHYSAQSLGLEHLPLRMLSYDRDKPVSADLGGLFHKPFVSVYVLGRADSHLQPVGMRAPSRIGLFNPGDRGLRGSLGENAFVHCAGAVNDADIVPLPVSQHPDAMRRLLFSEKAEPSLYPVCPENLHISSLLCRSARQCRP